jgi:hypothetical protein
MHDTGIVLVAGVRMRLKLFELFNENFCLAYKVLVRTGSCRYDADS